MKAETFRIIGKNPWEYLPVVNECIRILLTIGIGAVLGYFEVLKASSFVPQATRFVFYIALPALVLKGVGIGIDFYDDSFLWKFILSFLILRVIALISCALIVAIKRRTTPITTENRKQSRTPIGETAVLWLTATWISTIILGVPIASAVFGDASKGRTYGILAAISSFIFQLPLQSFFLECHLLLRDTEESEQFLEVSEKDEDENTRVQSKISVPQGTEETFEEKNRDQLKKMTQQQAKEPAPSSDLLDQQKSEIALWYTLIKRGDIWKKILGQVLRNPVLWGIGGGFALSLSTAGPKFLNPSSPDFVPGFYWLFLTTSWLGECVSPISLISMGVWMQSKGTKLFFGRVSFLSVLLCMACKLVLVPVVMLGLAILLDFNDEAGRAAVLIASLPISMASFSLASRYEIGEDILSQNVALGTALILPTVLVWNILLDAVGLFPI